MSLERVSLLDVVEDSYSAYYNIIKDAAPAGIPLAFRADFFQRGEKYWLSKSIKMWANETNEFVYCFSAPSFDEDLVSACIQFSLDDGLPRVVPHKEHQYTNIKALFIADEYKGDAINKIKSRKFSKSYNHSLWGYSNLVTCAVDASSEKIVANAVGRDMKAYFKKLFKVQHKS